MARSLTPAIKRSVDLVPLITAEDWKAFMEKAKQNQERLYSAADMDDEIPF
jgi:hypothetical protein